MNPITQNNMFDGAYYAAGIVDRTTRDVVAWYQTEYLRGIMEGNVSLAESCFSFLADHMNLDLFGGGVSVTNYRQIDSKYDTTFVSFLESNKDRFGVRKEVSFIFYNDNLHRAFAHDMILSYTDELRYVLDKGIKVYCYNGQNDLSVSPASLQYLLHSISWEHSREWRRAPKRLLRTAFGGGADGWEK